MGFLKDTFKNPFKPDRNFAEGSVNFADLLGGTPGTSQSAIMLGDKLGLTDKFFGFHEKPEVTGTAADLDPLASDALARLVPGSDDFRSDLRRRLEGTGLSSAAAAAGAERATQERSGRQLQAAQPIMSALQSLKNRLERTSEGINVTSGAEAFLGGFFG